MRVPKKTAIGACPGLQSFEKSYLGAPSKAEIFPRISVFGERSWVGRSPGLSRLEVGKCLVSDALMGSESRYMRTELCMLR